MRRITLITLITLATAVLAAACTGSPTVADANGVEITADDVHAMSAEPVEDVIDGDPFRRVLSLLIVNAVLLTTAEEQFGSQGLDDPDRIAAKMSTAPPQEQSVFESIAGNPGLTDAYAEGAAQYFVIRDAVIAELATGDLGDLQIEALFDNWASDAVESADVVVMSQVGIWNGNGGVLPPP